MPGSSSMLDLRLHHEPTLRENPCSRGSSSASDSNVPISDLDELDEAGVEVSSSTSGESITPVKLTPARFGERCRNRLLQRKLKAKAHRPKDVIRTGSIANRVWDTILTAKRSRFSPRTTPERSPRADIIEEAIIAQLGEHTLRRQKKKRDKGVCASACLCLSLNVILYICELQLLALCMSVYKWLLRIPRG